MLARDIITYMEKIAPVNLAYPDDLVGFVFGDPDKEVNRIGIGWAATEYVLEQAGVLQAGKFVKTRRTPKQKPFKLDKKKPVVEDEAAIDMLILHEYPFFEEICDKFPGLSFFEKPPNYSRLKDLVTKEVCVYVVHSNIDETEGGTVDILTKEMGIKVMGKIMCGRWGKIPESTLTSIVTNLKTAYGLDVVRIAGDPETNKKFEVIGCYIGDGLANLDVVEEFYSKGCHALISSGLTEDVARYASEIGIILIDAERSKLERPVMRNLTEKMQGEMKNMFITLYDCEEAIAYL